MTKRAFAGRGLALALAWAAAAEAQTPAVVLSYEPDRLHELAERLAWELRSEGYKVQWGSGWPAPCNADRSTAASLPASEGHERIWIAVRPDESAADRARALICLRDRTGSWVHVASTGPVAKPRESAISIAEALNGLRARLTPRPRAPHVGAQPPSSPPARPQEQPPPSAPNAGFVGVAVMGEPGSIPVVAGATAGVLLSVTPSLSVDVETFWPLKDATVDAPGGSVSTQLAWTRIGPRLHLSVGPAVLAASALMGPAIVWTSAQVEPPQVGTTDVGSAAIVSLSGSVGYPSSSAVFAYVAGGVSQLFPRFRIATGSETQPTVGRILLEGSFGLTVRWEGR